MAEKKSFALRIDPAMMKAIEKWAADEFRSVNGQIEWILHNALKEAGRVKAPPSASPDEKKDEA
ncbi:MAG: Arc family DNA-binding protein [Bacteroidetes bacterium]|nr:Arc family DNA-binding protein [Bacteroidota bacterium]